MRQLTLKSVIASLVWVGICVSLRAAEYPKPTPGDFRLRDFRFASGPILREVRIHYRTLGQLRRDERGIVRNAVLILHGTSGNGEQFLRPGAGAKLFAAELFSPGQPLDVNRYFVIIPDNLGHGQSTKPSDGLHARFPHYGYRDMIETQYRLLTDGLKVNHLRLVVGTSMGGMHTWLWGELHPKFMDALMPLACLPTSIAGRNRMWRHMISDAIRTDPSWHDGDYKTQPRGLKTAAQLMFLVSSNPVLRQQAAPTPLQADVLLERGAAEIAARIDANDLLYAVESSLDYDPGAGLAQIRAPLLAINFADDLINPPELRILERAIKQVKNAKAIVVPLSPETVGHGTHTKAAVWKKHLVEFLRETERE